MLVKFGSLMQGTAFTWEGVRFRKSTKGSAVGEDGRALFFPTTLVEVDVSQNLMRAEQLRHALEARSQLMGAQDNLLSIAKKDRDSGVDPNQNSLLMDLLEAVSDVLIGSSELAVELKAKLREEQKKV